MNGLLLKLLASSKNKGITDKRVYQSMTTYLDLRLSGLTKTTDKRWKKTQVILTKKTVYSPTFITLQPDFMWKNHLRTEII